MKRRTVVDLQIEGRTTPIRADTSYLRDLIAAAPGGEAFSRFVALAELAIELTECGAASGEPIEAGKTDSASETDDDFDPWPEARGPPTGQSDSYIRPLHRHHTRRLTIQPKPDRPNWLQSKGGGVLP